MSSSTGGEIPVSAATALERVPGRGPHLRRGRPGSTSPERSARRISTLSADDLPALGIGDLEPAAASADLREQLGLLGQRVGVGLVAGEPGEQAAPAAEPAVGRGEQPARRCRRGRGQAPRPGRATARRGGRDRRPSRRRPRRRSATSAARDLGERGRGQQARAARAPRAARPPRAARCPRTAPRRRRGGRPRSRCGGRSRRGRAPRPDRGRGRSRAARSSRTAPRTRSATAARAAPPDPSTPSDLVGGELEPMAVGVRRSRSSG